MTLALVDLCDRCGAVDPFGPPDARARVHMCLTAEQEPQPDPEYCCVSCRRVTVDQTWHTCPRITEDGTIYVFGGYDGEWVREVDGEQNWAWLLSPYYGKDRWGHPQHSPIDDPDHGFAAPYTDLREEDLDEPRWIVGFYVVSHSYGEPDEADIEYEEVLDTFEAAHRWALSEWTRRQPSQELG